MIYMEFILFGRSFTMRKNVKRLLCGLLAAALLIPAAAAAPASGQKAKLSDI